VDAARRHDPAIGAPIVDVSSRKEGDFTVVSVTGEVDLYSSPRMREAVLGALSKRSPNAIVDLSGVSYMDSSGIATLVEALQAARRLSGRLVLAGLTDRVREVFELARLQSVFELARSVEAAIASGGGGE
jgi:anti-sigma B factor antagonist